MAKAKTAPGQTGGNGGSTRLIGIGGEARRGADGVIANSGNGGNGGRCSAATAASRRLRGNAPRSDAAGAGATAGMAVTAARLSGSVGGSGDGGSR